MTTYRPTVDAPAPKPLAHLTVTERFRLYDSAMSHFGYAVTASLAEWALSVGLLEGPRIPSIDVAE